MPFYKKKPVVVEAIQFTGDNEIEIMKFVGVRLKVSKHPGERYEDLPNESINLVIPTLEGDMIANKMDFIIKGVKGEFYPCKPDIFLMTYEIEKA